MKVSDITVEKLEELGFIADDDDVDVYRYKHRSHVIFCNLRAKSVGICLYSYEYKDIPFTMQSVNKIIEIAKYAYIDYSIQKYIDELCLS